MQHNEESNKRAWKIFKDALDDTDFPDDITVSEREDGSFSLLLTMNSDKVGSITIDFTPSIEAIKPFLPDNSSDQMEENFHYSFAYEFARLFLKNFDVEIKQTFTGLNNIPLLLSRLVLAESQASLINASNKEIQSSHEESKNQIEEFCEDLKRKTKRRIQSQIEAANDPRKPVKHLIAHYYELYLPEWEKAKDCYKKNKNFDNWEKMIAVSFENLPQDLIKRLGDLDVYASMPSSIALEYASRLCSIKKDSLGLRALQKYLQRSREWMKNVGKESVQKEVGEYFNETLNEVGAMFAMSKLYDLGEPNFDEEPLLHQIIAEKYGDAIKKYNPKISGNKMERIFIEVKCEHFNDESDNNYSVH